MTTIASRLIKLRSELRRQQAWGVLQFLIAALLAWAVVLALGDQLWRPRPELLRTVAAAGLLAGAAIAARNWPKRPSLPRIAASVEETLRWPHELADALCFEQESLPPGQSEALRAAARRRVLIRCEQVDWKQLAVPPASSRLARRLVGLALLLAAFAACAAPASARVFLGRLMGGANQYPKRTSIAWAACGELEWTSPPGPDQTAVAPHRELLWTVRAAGRPTGGVLKIVAVDPPGAVAALPLDGCDANARRARLLRARSGGVTREALASAIQRELPRTSDSVRWGGLDAPQASQRIRRRAAHLNDDGADFFQASWSPQAAGRYRVELSCGDDHWGPMWIEVREPAALAVRLVDASSGASARANQAWIEGARLTALVRSSAAHRPLTRVRLWTRRDRDSWQEQSVRLGESAAWTSRPALLQPIQVGSFDLRIAAQTSDGIWSVWRDSVRAVADHPPTAKLAILASIATPRGEPPLRYEFRDDCAVTHARVTIERRDSAASWETLDAIDVPTSQRPAVRGELRLPLASYSLQPGDLLRLVVEASDTRTGQPRRWSRSRPHLLRIADRFEVLESVTALDAQVSAELDRVIQEALATPIPSREGRR